MPAGPAVDEQTVVVGMIEEPDGLVQDFSSSYATWVVLNTLLAKPVRYDDRWETCPQLLRELPAMRPAEDGAMEVTWRFRRDVTWHDGAPLTARDALRSYELLRDLPPPYPHYAVVRCIEEMRLPDPDDPFTLVTRWSAAEPWAPFEEWGTIQPAHLLRGVRFAGLDEAARHPLNAAPVGSGPYRFVEWERGRAIRVEAYPPYPLGAPRIRTIVFRFFPDPDRLADAVVAGEVDVTDLAGFQPAHLEEIARRTPDVTVHRTPGMLWEHIDVNLDEPWLRDRRVRRAIAHAIDREAIVRHALGPGRPVAHTWLPPRHPAHQPEVAVYPYDPPRARALLAEAGWLAGPDGVRWNREGHRLALTLLTTDESRDRFTSTAGRPAIAARIRDDLRRVGIDLAVELCSPAALLERILERRLPHLALFGWTMSLEANGYLMWHSSQLPTQTHGYATNVSGWANRESDALLEALVHEPDPARARALLRRQQQVWAEDLPAVPLFHWPWLTTSRRGLGRVRPVGVFGTYVTWNAHEWAWRRA